MRRHRLISKGLKGKAGEIAVRIKRYVRFSFQYLLLEKSRGLDFTMRDARLFRESNGKYHGYSKTNETHLREVFGQLSYKECRDFLDIGCGKGVVLKEAARYPFRSVTGIEIQEGLVETAIKNFKVLGLDGRVRCIQSDAACFEGYGEYDVFFLFNPFSEDVLRQVVDKIMEDQPEHGKTITVIYHNPRFPEIFEEAGFRIKKTLHDSLKEYDTYIFQMTPQGQGRNNRHMTG